jgi:DNA-binding CsgD family transcriptional regulator
MESIDVSQINASVDLFYEASMNPARWPAALEALSEAVSAKGAMLRPLRGAGKDFPVTESMLPMVEQLRAWEANGDSYFPQTLVDAQAATRFFTERDIFQEEDLSTSPLFNSVLYPAGVNSFASASVLNVKGEQVLLTLYRPIGSPSFNDAACGVLTQFLPHFRRAAAVSMELCQSRSMGVLEGLSTLQCGAMLLDRVGGIAGMNKRARALLGPHVRIEENILKVDDPKTQARLDGQIRVSLDTDHANDHQFGDFVVLRRGVNLRPLVLQVIPLAGCRHKIFQAASAIILFNDLNQQAAARPDLLAAVLDLRPSEARVAALLADGFTLAEISDTLRLSRETVRSYVKAILSKARVSRQSAFMAIAKSLQTPLAPAA